MNRGLLSLALLAFVGSQAHAGQVPAAGRKDARMRTVVYDPGQVVRLSTAIGGALVVSFSPDEKISAVAASNSKDLIANPRDSFLFMKAKTALPPQSVIVLTLGPRGVRRYVFEVESKAPANGTSDIYYSVEFVYPRDRAVARAAAQEQRAVARQLNFVRSEISNTGKALSGNKNWRYVGVGSRAIQPTRVFDNGYSTAFYFPANMRIPSIFRINPDGREAAVNYNVKGGYVIVGGVAPGWRLRDGTAMLCVWNRAYDKIGTPPRTNTASARVRRVTMESPK